MRRADHPVRPLSGRLADSRPSRCGARTAPGRPLDHTPSPSTSPSSARPPVMPSNLKPSPRSPAPWRRCLAHVVLVRFPHTRVLRTRLIASGAAPARAIPEHSTLRGCPQGCLVPGRWILTPYRRAADVPNVKGRRLPAHLLPHHGGYAGEKFGIVSLNTKHQALHTTIPSNAILDASLMHPASSSARPRPTMRVRSSSSTTTLEDPPRAATTSPRARASATPAPSWA